LSIPGETPRSSGSPGSGGVAASRLKRQCSCRPRRDCLRACSCRTLSLRSRAAVGPGRCDAKRARLWRRAGASRRAGRDPHSCSREHGGPARLSRLPVSGCGWLEGHRCVGCPVAASRPLQPRGGARRNDGFLGRRPARSFPVTILRARSGLLASRTLAEGVLPWQLTACGVACLASGLVDACHKDHAAFNRGGAKCERLGILR
jgi:hypothetical protein